MKITAIQAQVRQAGRYSVFVDGKYSFSLSDIALLDSKIVNGQELTPEQVREFKQLSADDKLYGLVLRYAMLRPRSVWEVEEYLARKQVSDSQRSTILNKLSKLQVIDDEQFARRWVENRRLLKPLSRRRLEQELRQKRVADTIIRDVLADDEQEDEQALAELIARKRKQVKYQDNTKLMQYLARQGFSYDDIKQALQAVDADGV